MNHNEKPDNLDHKNNYRSSANIKSDNTIYNESNLASLIDHTLLKSDATIQDIENLCLEARKYSFAAVCINPSYVSHCVRLLNDTPVKVCTVIGFPLGANSTVVKTFETEQAIRDGASEVDMVINIGMLKSGKYDYVKKDIFEVVKTAKKHGVVVKVIIETALLTDEEKVIACSLSKSAGADFVKTSTGFSKSGATAADVALMRKTVGNNMGVKASGGIKTRQDALQMIASGANRIGTSSSVKIVSGEINKVTEIY